MSTPTVHRCSDCEKSWKEDELIPLERLANLLMRVDPGEPMPSGECPECRALCHPVKQKWMACCPDPECQGTDLEWRTYAFFAVTGAELNDEGEPYMMDIAIDKKPVSVDYEADGEIYCNDCTEFHGRPRYWESWKLVDDA